MAETNVNQLGRITDATKIEYSVQQLICGRNRKNIKFIESQTSTAIYFPPPFSNICRYRPQNSVHQRDPNEIIITGDKPHNIELAKMRLHELFSRARLCVKDVSINAEKIDSILLGRMDKVRKIIEANGTFILFPPLASRQGVVRIQALESLHAERTARDLMALVG